MSIQVLIVLKNGRLKSVIANRCHLACLLVDLDAGETSEPEIAVLDDDLERLAHKIADGKVRLT
jgi:hypothetical protein